MRAIESPELNRFRAIRAAVGAVILALFVAGLFAIGVPASADAPKPAGDDAHRVPDAASVAFPSAEPEALPPTF